MKKTSLLYMIIKCLEKNNTTTEESMKQLMI